MPSTLSSAHKIKQRFKRFGLILMSGMIVLGAFYFLHQPRSRDEQSLSSSASTSATSASTATHTANKFFESLGTFSTIDRLYPQSQRELSALVTSIKTINEKTPQSTVYQLFLDLKQRIHDHPQELSALDRLDLTSPPLNQAAKRQLSLIYGALSQSAQPAAWRFIAEGLQKGSDEFVSFQAVAAAADFAAPPPEAYELLNTVWNSHPNEEIRNTALLAMGSVAKVNHDVRESIAADIERTLAAQDPWQLDVALAAAGNHGDNRYWPAIQRLASHPSEMLRARAIFAARALTSPDITHWIGATAAADTSDRVQLDGLKALAERTHFDSVATQIALIGTHARSHEVLAHSVRSLANRLTLEKAAARDGLLKLRALAAPDTANFIDQVVSQH